MSGICGFLNFDNEDLIKDSTISSMAISLKNLNGEEIRTIIDKNIGLGLVSFSSQDYSIVNNEIFVVATGEIYDPPDDSLALTIAKLYQKYQGDCVRHIEGQFNFCIWDKKERKLLLATDRFGTSVLNYYYDNKRFIFASKIKAILKTDIFEPSIDKSAIYNYLVFSFVPTPQSIYKEIKKIPPGCTLVLYKGELNLYKYWDVFYVKSKNKGKDYYCKRIRETVEDAVRKRISLNSDIEHTGAFLSGGLDSSTVSGMMRKITGNEIKTFSVVFHEREYSEIEYINIAVRHFGLKNYKYFLKPNDVIDAIKILIKEYDEPFGNSSAIAAYYCMKLAKDNDINVMLGGDGGDENFAGYERYVTNKLFSLYQYMPKILRKAIIEPCILNIPFKEMWFIKKAGNYINHSNIPNPERFFSYPFYPLYNKKEIFTDDFLKDIDIDFPRKIINNYYGLADTGYALNRLMYLDTKLGLIDNDLRGKIDKIAQILGITVRYPMLDAELWRLGAEIPGYLKLRGFTKKYIFKQALKNFLPKEIILKKKHGFGLPYAPWLRNNKDIRKFTEEILLDPKVLTRGYFRKGFFEEMLKKHDIERSPYYGDILWIFLMLELWHREWVDKKLFSVEL